jgi:hypothetical protein
MRCSPRCGPRPWQGTSGRSAPPCGSSRPESASWDWLAAYQRRRDRDGIHDCSQARCLADRSSQGQSPCPAPRMVTIWPASRPTSTAPSVSTSIVAPSPNGAIATAAASMRRTVAQQERSRRRRPAPVQDSPYPSNRNGRHAVKPHGIQVHSVARSRTAIALLASYAHSASRAIMPVWGCAFVSPATFCRTDASHECAPALAFHHHSCRRPGACR